MRRVVLFILSSVLACSVFAKGPSVVAKANHALWQTAINTPESFDTASRAALLVYAVTLQAQSNMTEGEIKKTLKLKSANKASVDNWLHQELKQTLTNYQHAAKTCTQNDWTCINPITSEAELIQQAKTIKIPNELSAWQHNLKQFTHAYSLEQIRLAALFPKVSSEIALFNTNEWNGDAFADKQFLLSFDDGPSAVQGNTDKVLVMLSQQQKSALFFILGENWQTRLNKTNATNLATLYQNQCVAIHGWQHQSHAKWTDWQDSILRTQNLILDTLKQSPNAGSFSGLFRPPYGQRKADSGTFFQQHGLQVALWNLDSQDWNTQVNSNDIVNRMITLMLIKRHGVLLFHDIHPKADQALPVLFNKLGNAVNWMDCSLSV